jgi:hypothetical protein
MTSRFFVWVKHLFQIGGTCFGSVTHASPIILPLDLPNNPSPFPQLMTLPRWIIFLDDPTYL